MSLAHRPAARFFAAFYRWNLQNRPSSLCAMFSHRHRCGAHSTHASFARSYHATRHLLQQPENGLPQQNDLSPSKIEDINGILEHTDANQRDATRIAVTDIPDLDAETEALKSSLRALMRNVPTSVAVVTAAGVDPKTQEHVPLGVAVSSLTTVSMDPPMISFNLKEPSQTLNAIRAAKGLFRIHIPSANKGGANIVEKFSQGNHTAAYNMRRKSLRKLWVPIIRRDSRSTDSMAPQIWDDDVQAAMECTVTQELPVADHVILVAKIDSIERRVLHCPAVLYFQGKYMRVDGTSIKVHAAPTPATSDQTIQKVWDCAQFPGEKERREYMEHIKAFIKADKSHLELGNLNIARLIMALPYQPQALGINVRVLVAECRSEMGLPNPQLPVAQRDTPVLDEFYGRLAPSSREIVIERAKKMVSHDVRFLDLEYATLLQHLGVSSFVKDLLPSDIMKPLRAAGLVDSISTKGNDTYNNIYRLEKIEKNLVQYMRTLRFEEAASRSWDHLMEHSGGDNSTKPYFRNARPRLLTMTQPVVFSRENLDISGHVSEAETRVVLRRIVHYLFVSNQSQYRRYKGVAPGEILRRVHVDPTITGMDVEYFLAKIEHIYQFTHHFRDFAPKVNELLGGWFEYDITWDELKSRVKQFVEATPLRATKWSKADQMAALGLHHYAKVQVPGQDVPQEVRSDVLLATLVAKELRDFYGTGTPRENTAIAKFLKETYDYEVHAKAHLQPDRLDLEQGDSSIELREAMLSNLNVDVSGGTMAKRYK
ncbi:hypothetical protein T440DRAFT_448890 [Plenodomus tracheiphilus IPT5]|uniref:Flavin reductase like domain-containing protein n=1 Tax=Plenodomus tracheiphilus IPT5 TaxID=1408161 RepID=A0A6A7B8Q8_9PLEO|nr:hypothetical protein T440DRAFT_448890 [Plenodomus tracheiphilus IPT5]